MTFDEDELNQIITAVLDDLQTTCYACGGIGKVPRAVPAEECPTCGGKGLRLRRSGQNLIEFVEMWINRQRDDTMETAFAALERRVKALEGAPSAPPCDCTERWLAAGNQVRPGIVIPCEHIK